MGVPELTAQYLRDSLHYDPETGIFRWRECRDKLGRVLKSRIRTEAGYAWRHPRGTVTYRMITLLDWPFAAHRLAWLYMTGEWPADRIDHEDTDGLNNRWANLREATHAQNMANTGAPKTNTTGFKGVTFSKRHGRYQAQIKVNGRNLALGRYATPEEAHRAYAAAAVKYRGEFGRAV